MSLLAIVRKHTERTVREDIDMGSPAGNIDPEVVDATTDEQIALQEAQDDLTDRRYFLLSTEKCEEFLNLLERPAQSNPGLERLFSRKTSWESQG